MQPPAAIPIPDAFPVTWPSAEAELGNWQQDRMHAPQPMSPMAFWWAEIFAQGFSDGLANLKVPMVTRLLRINTYYYMSVGPNVPPEELIAREPEIEASVREAMAKTATRWDTEWLPEIRERWDRWCAIELADVEDRDLESLVNEAAALHRRLWEIHFEMLLPAMIGMSAFVDLYQDLFPGSAPLQPYALLQGVDNMSLAAGRALWRISRTVRSDPALADLVRSTPSTDLAVHLGRTAQGREVLEQVDAYLDEFGRRSDGVQEMSVPSWTENPAPVYDNLKAYVDQDEDPDVALRAGAEEAARLIGEARAALRNYPEAVVGAFEGLLAVATEAGRLQEDHNFWIDQRCLHEMRQLCREIGRRLVRKGQLAEANDIFMLDMAEALALLDGRRTDGKEIVSERQREMAYWARIQAPPFLGTDYGPPPDNPITRALMKFFGAPPATAASPKELRGNSGSAGKATGTARVVMHIGDAGRLRNGDILVAPTTAPPWTPFFATIAGIVTETGGPLSHCAIVAREYHIPAVVGVPGATALIRDGDTIEVDGDTGQVHIRS